MTLTKDSKDSLARAKVLAMLKGPGEVYDDDEIFRRGERQVVELREKLDEVNRLMKEQEETAKKIASTTEKIGEDIMGANNSLKEAKG